MAWALGRNQTAVPHQVGRQSLMCFSACRAHSSQEDMLLKAVHADLVGARMI